MRQACLQRTEEEEIQLSQLQVLELQLHELSVLHVAVPGPAWHVSFAAMQVSPHGFPSQQTGPSLEESWSWSDS